MENKEYLPVGSYNFESTDSKTGILTKTGRSSRIYFLLAVVACLLCLGLGIVIGWFSHTGTDSSESHKQSNIIDTTEEILSGLSKDNIRSHLELLTKKPRLPGTNGDHENVEYIASQMRAHGLDSVKITPYDVLLSYPNQTHPNKIQLINISDGTVVFTSQKYEKNLRPGVDNAKIVRPYNSYAPAGVKLGQLIYVNYGRIEDFLYLAKNKSIDFTGKIVIARYGKIFRGDKVKTAWKYNASGVILYTDPADFNIGNDTYPDSWWMPPSGLQRGTVGGDGDYLTPFYPATYYAHRLDVEEVDLPKIPSQPIGYGDAYHLLSRLAGDPVPKDWQGGLNFTYQIGQAFNDANLEVRLEVNNYNELKTVENVLGYIRGSHEPDRYIFMGNHHDAWAYGAIDPLSGTAVSLEITRMFGDMLKRGWRPRRTIVFCSWGGEEVGLLGSTEWVEEHLKVIYERGVAYLNVDYAVDFTYVLSVGISPLLQDAMYSATKKVPNPDSESDQKTLYDVWRKRLPKDKSDTDSEPDVYYSLGSGSDMATFYQRAGVPSTDFWYTYDQKKWPILSYPLYHSAYETFYMYEQFIDPSFTYTLAMGHLWAILACDIADAEVLPYDTRRYSAAIEHFVSEMENSFGDIWKQNNVDIENLKSAVNNFSEATSSFQEEINTIDKSSELVVRQINDKLIQLERAFIDPEGLPGRPIYKHVIFAPSQYDAYSDNSFPGIVDTMFDIEHNGYSKWELLKQQIYVATYFIQTAAETLTGIGL